MRSARRRPSWGAKLVSRTEITAVQEIEIEAPDFRLFWNPVGLNLFDLRSGRIPDRTSSRMMGRMIRRKRNAKPVVDDDLCFGGLVCLRCQSAGNRLAKG